MSAARPYAVVVTSVLLIGVPSVGGCSWFGGGASDPSKKAEDAPKGTSAEAATEGAAEAATGGDGQAAMPQATEPVACGKATCDAGSYCCWNGKTKSGKCEADMNACAFGEETALGCSGAKACGDGNVCCRNAVGGFACSEKIECGRQMSGSICETPADCPPIGMKEATGCKAEKDLAAPVAIKMCAYD